MKITLLIMFALYAKGWAQGYDTGATGQAITYGLGVVRTTNAVLGNAILTNLPMAEWHLSYYTNVVESDNHQGSQYGGNYYTLEIKPANWVYPGTYVAPTERTWTTNVVEHLIVTLRINGEQRVLVQERQVSSTSYTEVLRQEWIPKPKQ